jgi:hypothetical protein
MTVREPTVPTWLKAHARYLWPLFLVVPLIIALAWGEYLPDAAYTVFSLARNLAAGRTLAYGTIIDGAGASLHSPLYVLMLALLDRLGVPVLRAGIIVSAMGCGATALAVYAVGRATGQPIAAVIAAVLIALSPLAVSTLGTETAWVLALCWTAVALALRKRWWAQSSVLALTLWMRFSWDTLALAALMLAHQWIERRRFPLRSALTVGLAALIWLLIAIPLPGSLLPSPGFSLLGCQYVQQRLAESDLYWLLLPPIILGIYTIRQRAVWIVVLWSALALVGTGLEAGAAPGVMGLFLASVGGERTIRWITAQDLSLPGRIRRHTLAWKACLVLGVLLLLGAPIVCSLQHRYRNRPVDRHAIERQAADWLSSYADPDTVVLDSGPIGHMADLPTLLWDGIARDRTGMSRLMDRLNADLPEYAISRNTVAWGWLAHTDWFQDRYEPVQHFETEHDAASPVTIWRYRQSDFDRGKVQTVNHALPGGVRLVGFQYWPERIAPGDTVSVTLFFQSTQPVARAFETRVRVFSRYDGTNWGHRNRMTPTSVPVDWWQPGQVIAERFALQTATTTPVGAYLLDLTVPETDTEGLVLGYVAVPWQGDMEGIALVGAQFSDQITLVGFETESSDAEIAVTLYWEALRRPEDDYIAFVHLATPDGQTVTSHDGVPMDRRYSTLAWIPGEVVPDTHRIPRSGILAGAYLLRAGMYRWPSMERLPTQDSDGVEQADRAITLHAIEVP